MKKTLIAFALTGLLAYLVHYFYFKPMLVLGQPAPAFSTTDIHQEPLGLDDFRGKYLLIDFWGSWCGPCRRENPILVMMYEKYRDVKFKQAEGIAFLSIALENDVEQGLRAIADDRLIWPHHVIETDQLQSPMAQLFGIRSIPSKYLIGPDGRIALSDPNIAELDAFLAYQKLKN
ncbi:MAG: TlpA family protein disulfide reductase [Saprospiraceae bacterium]|nr:TlpA family protein disulfide reductase [Saprospiraceae bacterium]